MGPSVGRQFAILVLWIALSLIVIMLQSTNRPRNRLMRHSFAIYSPKGFLLAQGRAIPDYKERPPLHVSGIQVPCSGSPQRVGFPSAGRGGMDR